MRIVALCLGLLLALPVSSQDFSSQSSFDASVEALLALPGAEPIQSRINCSPICGTPYCCVALRLSIPPDAMGQSAQTGVEPLTCGAECGTSCGGESLCCVTCDF